MPTMSKVVHMLDDATLGRPVIVCTGVGSHQSIVAREFSWDYPTRMLITSCGHGTMGSCIPLAIGAALERPNDLVLCINGDGSMNMDAPHLATISELGLPIKIVVLDNNSMGIVRQFEDLQGFQNVATANRRNPDFATLAFANLIQAFKPYLTEHWDIDGWRGFIGLDGPALAHVRVSDYGVWPILESGRTNGDMTYERL